ncbi:PWWP domain-containing protein 4-like [Rhododendron vialii]|uniref:PWWP domain-containing protein 4-like n=1 Tax=Rhododendron vialii TaxID=182163 RepID=UPI00265E2F64|nr:PWWP domain-containing protein 4-like [Rhododendron vialii]XP_058221272.1 PWWP domain-containing protein 4-like [Rhododendron vialii]XP_058221273.1 PWWP domain-containing protein 4-like [Rhododendron vialii]XP_058221275.1 PWWP domain-containing protein 4-like [Rhododendron vialii]
MKRKRHSANGSYADKEDGGGAACNQTSKEVVLGDLIWVSLHGSSWWPAQVFDDNAVSRRNKPRKRSTGEVLVRLYGSYKYMYVDPIKCRSEFDNILKQKNGNYSEIFEKALEQDLGRLRSGRGNTKKGSTSQEPIERRMKVMQRLGLTALSGSLFRQNGHIDPDLLPCS